MVVTTIAHGGYGDASGPQPVPDLKHPVRVLRCLSDGHGIDHSADQSTLGFENCGSTTAYPTDRIPTPYVSSHCLQ